MKKIKLIIDTDMGGDCDDAGAFAIAHNMCAEGLGDIIGTVCCVSEISAAVTAKAINEWYQKGDIPVGMVKDEVFLEDEKYKKYSKTIMDEYLKRCPMPRIFTSVKLLRKLLAENNNVTIAVIGMQNNIEALLKSKGDEISPLSGLDLVKKSVRNMYVMGGNFENTDDAEYNIRLKINSAQYVAENFPAPIIYCGWEAGVNIWTGSALLDCVPEHPVKRAYELYVDNDNLLRPSWDLVTVFCAINQENKLYRKSENLTVSFDSDGKTVITKGGKDCYLIANTANEKITDKLNEYLK